ncbi:MAG TPA: YceI family protein [Rudaea sp.]|nr:YceI family protein [Rudaea sp.]
MFRSASLLALALAVLGGGVRAGDDVLPSAGEPGQGDARLTLDPLRSSAEFEVKVLWLIGVHGRFGQVHGTITVDRDHAREVADAWIEVGTITMRNHSYEEWVKSAEFFDAARFPQIHFVSEPFSRDRLRRGGEIGGTLTVRGIDRHIALEVEPSECPDAVARTCAVQASGSIRRSDFGMRSHRGTLSDKVELGFSIYLDPATGAEAASR